jgi:hypothetical protein
MSAHPNFSILLFLGVAFFGGLALAITGQILWTQHRKKRRQGFPVEPPHVPSHR